MLARDCRLTKCMYGIAETPGCYTRRRTGGRFGGTSSTSMLVLESGKQVGTCIYLSSYNVRRRGGLHIQGNDHNYYGYVSVPEGFKSSTTIAQPAALNALN